MPTLNTPVRLIRSFEQYLNACLMSPVQFMELHPDLSREQVARIAGCSPSTVQRWFYKTENRLEPQKKHCLRLGLAHQFLSLALEE